MFIIFYMNIYVSISELNYNIDSFIQCFLHSLPIQALTSMNEKY